MQGYSTKFIGNELILSNFLEASGIQTDANLAFSQQDLQKLNAYIKDEITMPQTIRVASKYMTNPIKSSILLYKASRNGWNASTFDQLVNNRGPTITIAILQDGRYIGAYSPISWGTVNNDYISNPDTFLFDSNTKYTTAESIYGPNNYAIWQASGYGPVFGGGYDFSALQYSNQQFNGQAVTYINNGKGPLGVSIYTNNNYILKDLEVYSIIIGTGENPSATITPKIMYGPWISIEQQTQIMNINNEKYVHIIFDDIYTKMVSSDGEEKYYRGNIQQFDPNNWDNYNNTGGGKYLLKDQ
jgi:hypothetical protein